MMALGIVRRWSWLPVVAGVCGLLQACSGASGDDDSSDSSGCTKDSDCRDGRICENKACVDDPNNGAVLGGSSGTGSGGTTSASGGTGFQGKGGTGGTGGSTQGGSGGTTGGASGTSNGGSASGSGGTGGNAAGTGGSAAGTAGSAGTSGTCSEDDPATCPTPDSMTFCYGGALVTYDCSEYCDALGFPIGPCAEPDGCACDFEKPTDATCVAATNGVCGCFDGSDTPCVDTVDPANPDSIYFYPPFIYASCHGGSTADMDFLHCIAAQTMLDPAPMCTDAFDACGATGAAGSAG